MIRYLVFVGVLSGCLSAYAAPGILNYQAKLTDSGGAPINTMVSINFTFWDSPDSGNQLGAGFSDTDVVTPVNGVCSTDIGDDPGNLVPASVFAASAVWLNVNVNGEDVVPRTRVAASGYALNALPLYGEAYIIVEAGNNPVVNGKNLLAAYARAKLMTPHAEALSTTNRLTLLIPPGKYDLTTDSLYLNGEHIDVAGISTARADQYIYGVTNGPGTGVLGKSVDDVRIENLTVECTRVTGVLPNNSSDPTAFYPIIPGAGTTIRNCEFKATDETHARSMRYNVKYLGKFIDCAGGKYAFGGGPTGEAAADFTNCTGTDYAFGGNGGDASGNFFHCSAGDFSFGSNGNANGTFSNCKGAFYSFGGNGGTASGTFRDCFGANFSFAGGSGIASGTFVNCQGTDAAFGGEGTATGSFTNCVAGNIAFGGDGDTHFGNGASGTFTNCVAGFNSFGGNFPGPLIPISCSGKFIHCVGGTNCFGANGNATGAKFYYCTGDASSFGGTGSPTYFFCLRANALYP